MAAPSAGQPLAWSPPGGGEPMEVKVEDTAPECDMWEPDPSEHCECEPRCSHNPPTPDLEGADGFEAGRGGRPAVPRTGPRPELGAGPAVVRDKAPPGVACFFVHPDPGLHYRFRRMASLAPPRGDSCEAVPLRDWELLSYCPSCNALLSFSPYASSTLCCTACYTVQYTSELLLRIPELRTAGVGAETPPRAL